LKTALQSDDGGELRWTTTRRYQCSRLECAMAARVDWVRWKYSPIWTCSMRSCRRRLYPLQVVEMIVGHVAWCWSMKMSISAN